MTKLLDRVTIDRGQLIEIICRREKTVVNGINPKTRLQRLLVQKKGVFFMDKVGTFTRVSLFDFDMDLDFFFFFFDRKRRLGSALFVDSPDAFEIVEHSKSRHFPDRKSVV